MDKQRQKRLNGRYLWQGPMLNLRQDDVEMPSGQRVQRVVLEHPGAVAVVALTEQERVLLVRQWRYPVEQALLELPAGCLEPGEDPIDTAERELQEEAGVRPGRLEKLAEFYTAPGFCNEKMYLYLATELSAHVLPGDDDEDIEVIEMSLDEALANPLVQKDAKTYLGIMLAVQHLRGKR